jgi:hypothetical protein
MARSLSIICKANCGKCSEGFRILLASFGVAFGSNRNVLLVVPNFLLSPISRGPEARLPSEPLMHRKLEYFGEATVYILNHSVEGLNLAFSVDTYLHRTPSHGIR